MIKVINKLLKIDNLDSNILDDLITIINKISEDKFVEAVMSIQPFKPKFKSMKVFKKIAPDSFL
jgi:hypothetical protein